MILEINGLRYANGLHRAGKFPYNPNASSIETVPWQSSEQTTAFSRSLNGSADDLGTMPGTANYKF
jgi:hypothetical protein